MTGESRIQVAARGERAGLDLHGGKIREACEGLGIPEEHLLDLSADAPYLSTA